MNSNLYSSLIVHERFKPFKHKFKYFIPSFLIDYDDLTTISKKIRIFSYNKFNLYSFYEKDHGYRNGTSLISYVKDFLDKNNILYEHLNVKILCFPRILGYSFNPLSTIYCYEKEKILAIFYEVKNTSNEQHTYFFVNKNNNKKKIFEHTCSKNFYVSPFITMKGNYRFYNNLPNDKISIIIELLDENHDKILVASQFGHKTDFNSTNLLKYLLLNPLLTFKVIFAILFEAFRIILKGGKYYSRKKKIKDTTSFEGTL